MIPDQIGFVLATGAIFLRGANKFYKMFNENTAKVL